MAENSSGKSVSSWMTTASMPTYAALQSDTSADVCVVGAGIAGLTTAYLLAKEGQSVVLLDDGPITGGQTQRTTAHLSNAIDDRYVEIERLHGQDKARLAAASHTAAIDLIESIVHDERIDCDFTRLDGYLFLGPEQKRELLDDELAAAQRAGVAGVEMAQLPRAGAASGPCLRFPRQGQFHPLKYLAGVAAACERLQVRIFTGVHVAKIEGGNPAVVTTAHGRRVTAHAVVVATNTPINDLVATHTKQSPYTTYVIGLLVPRDAVRTALYWDMVDPYHYVRVQPLSAPQAEGPTEGSTPRDLLIVGGEDHKTGQADDQGRRFAALEAWTREHFPTAEEVQYRWSGQVMETIDGLAFIGRNPLDSPNIYIATGDSGMGMTHGTIAGMLLTDLIRGRSNPWAELYDPSRKPLRALGEFVKENLNVMRQYADWLTSGDVASPDEIPRGSGAVMRRGVAKVAVYRDEQGTVHEMSAVCPHLGCIVHWNDVDKTWDCPCHGSRFSSLGTVVNGPANRGLSDVKSSDAT